MKKITFRMKDKNKKLIKKGGKYENQHEDVWERDIPID